MQDDPSGDLGRAAKLAAAVLIGVVAVDVLAVLFDFLERGVLNDAAAGHVNASAASASDSRQRSMGIAQLIFVIAAAVTFLHWFRIAYSNLASLGVRDLRYRPGWAVGAWFVPILNVFRPKQIANDIWRASDPAAEPRQGWRERPVAPLLHWWWAFWLLSSFVERLASRAGRGDPDVSGLLAANGADIAGLVLDVIAALLAITVVRRTTERQREALEAGVINPPPPPPAPTLPVVPGPE